MSNHLLPVGLLIACGLGGFPGFALDDAASQDPAADAPLALQLELSTPRGLYSPTRPIWLRLTLRNTSDEAVEIPLQATPGTKAGIALPPELAFGTAEAPALLVAYQDEKPVAVPPPAFPESPAPAQAGLRLAPRGSVGTEIDLREYFPRIRYAGSYRVEWRPLAGRAGGRSVAFRVEPRKEAIIVTDKGKITFSLMYDEAPRNVENFLDLVQDGFYDGKTVHKIIPGFVIQGGCPQGDGTGIRPDGKLVPAEFHDAPFDVGTLAMARKPAEPNSASCQFFITLTRLPELDGQYTIIGRTSDEESLRTLNQIAAEPTDRRDRPRLPLIIRSLNLVNAEQGGTTRFDLKPTRSTTAAPSNPSNPPPHKGDKP